MLKEAIQYVLENMRPEAQNLGNRAYIITQKGAQEVIETPIAPDTVPLHSLDSIVKMIRTEAIHLADVNRKPPDPYRNIWPLCLVFRRPQIDTIFQARFL